MGRWKFHKALYEHYGGRVIFQQAGIEPLDAYRQWLEENEKAGHFRIEDSDFRSAFWKYYVNEKMHIFLDASDFEKEGTGRPFEKPWWLLKKNHEE